MKRWGLINISSVFYDSQFFFVIMQLDFVDFIPTLIVVETLKNDN